VSEEHFTSIHTLEENGAELRKRQLSSELDLHTFARMTVETQVMSIINCMGQDAVLQQKLQLHGSISFENHANMLSPEDLVEALQELTVSGGQEQAQQSQPNQPQTPPPRADTFCVYSVGNETGNVKRRLALVMELKPPHKLTLDHIHTGLKEMDVDDIVQEHLNEDATRKCQRLVAAVITQAFSYMVTSGLETSCVYTGDAIIFLRIPEDNPSQVYYSLAVPREDVGPSTGWTPDLDQDNRLHLTAVGQLLAFTLRAIQSAPRSSQWRRVAKAQLPRWEIAMEELEDLNPPDSVPSSEYRPSPKSSTPHVLSPISKRLRRRPVSASCASEVVPPTTSDSDDDGDGESGSGSGPGPETPSRAQPSSRGAKETTSSKKQQSERNTSKQSYIQQDLGPYCTSLCIKGLVEGGILDPQCPNVHSHGQERHEIDLQKFQELVRKLLRDQVEYCEELYIYGATGVMYRIRLPNWGYTVIAKGTSRSLQHRLRHEADVYKQLRPVQGQYCPVYLGIFPAGGELWYAGIVLVTHLMAMSYEGQSLLRHQCPEGFIDQALRGFHAIQGYNVLHGDVALRNMLYDTQLNRVVWHDFDRSTIISDQTKDRGRLFTCEMNALMNAMRSNQPTGRGQGAARRWGRRRENGERTSAT